MSRLAGKKTIEVEIYSDVICPWCLIGHHRLIQALKLIPEIHVDITWLPFELNSDMPETGMDRQAYLDQKFGPERAREVYGHIAKILDQEGLDADVSRIKRTPNTFKAHRLIYLARQTDKTGDAAMTLKLELLDAYFRQGADIGVDETLLACALKAGLDGEQVSAWLSGSDGTNETRALQARAGQLGIQGVPFFIIGKQFGLSGAQPPETLADAIRQAASNQ